jgi:hypothetical protein
MTVIDTPQTVEMVSFSGVNGTTARADELAQLGERMRDFVVASKAPATLRAYASDWRAFTAWCDERGLQALPAEPATVAACLSDLAGTLAVATLERRKTSISVMHKTAGHGSPTATELVATTMKGIRRVFGTAPVRKAPLWATDIRALVATLDTSTLRGVYDRALLVIGFAGAFWAQRTRRPERPGHRLHARRPRRAHPQVEDRPGRRRRRDRPSLRVRPADVPGQDGAGLARRLRDHGRCDLPAVDRHGRFVARQGRQFVPVGDPQDADHISGRAVAERVKRACKAAGLDAARYGGHSLRAGLITSAMEGGATEHRTMKHSRHCSVHVFRGYIRGLNLLDGSNPVAKVGL